MLLREMWGLMTDPRHGYLMAFNRRAMLMPTRAPMLGHEIEGRHA